MPLRRETEPPVGIELPSKCVNGKTQDISVEIAKKPASSALRRHATGFAFMCLGIIAFSSLGTAMNMLGDRPPLVKTTWRQVSATLAMLLPFVSNTFLVSKTEFRRILQQFRIFWWRIAISGLCMGLFSDLFFWSLHHTTLPRAYLLSCSQPIILVMWSKIRRHPLSLKEQLGTVVGFSGLAITCIDLHEESDAHNLIFGDLAALASAVVVCFFLIISKEVTAHIPLYSFLFPLNVFVTLFVACSSLILEGSSFDSHPQNGLFGWIHREIAWFMVYFACGNMMALSGYVLALGMLSPLVVSIGFLCEPVCAVIIGLVFDATGTPGPATICGGLVTLFGAGAVIYGSYERENHLAKDELLPDGVRSDSTATNAQASTTIGEP